MKLKINQSIKQTTVSYQENKWEFIILVNWCLSSTSFLIAHRVIFGPLILPLRKSDQLVQNKVKQEQKQKHLSLDLKYSTLSTKEEL